MSSNLDTKKKVGIISIHYGVNFGSALQAYALAHYIEDNYGYYSEVINYIPARYRFKKLYKLPNYSINTILHWIVGSIRHFRRDFIFKSFLKKVVCVSPAIYSETKARERYANYDFLIAGSDQIWNSDYNEGIDPMYYLSFSGDHTHKIAYAASAGKTLFSDDEWELQKEYLKSFSSISYREKSMISLMEDHGIFGGELVLDPTFLFTASQWSLIEKKPTKCPNDYYLLIYLIDTDSQEMLNIAKSIARKMNLKTVIICSGRKSHFSDFDYIANNLNPRHFLWLFRNASYIVTNSFHGVSFSINFEKQFVCFKRDKYNSRLDSILETMSLNDRYITFDNYYNAYVSIDYSRIRETKTQLIDKSKIFIDNSLLV